MKRKRRGGGMNTEQTIGATDRLGPKIVERSIHFGEVHATLYLPSGQLPRDKTSSVSANAPRESAVAA